MSAENFPYRIIIELFVLEGTFKIPTPCHGPGHLPLSQVAQSPIQPGLGHYQGWSSHSFSGKPVPGPHHPHREEFLALIQSKPPLCQCEAIAPCPVTPDPCQESLSVFPLSSLWALEGHNEVTPKPHLQGEKSQFPQPFLTAELIHPSDAFGGPALAWLQQLPVPPMLCFFVSV